MTGWLPDDATSWAGRPIVRRVADAEARHRAVLTGVVRAIVAHRGREGSDESRLGAGGTLDAYLADGTGEIVVRWLGRDAIAGVAPGATMEVDGTVIDQRGTLLLLNPRYRFSPSPGLSPGMGVAVASDGSESDGSESDASDQAETSTSW